MQALLVGICKGNTCAYHTFGGVQDQPFLQVWENLIAPLALFTTCHDVWRSRREYLWRQQLDTQHGNDIYC